MLRAHQLYDKPAFNHAWISGHVVDRKGEKMSKSKGNSIYPEEMIEKYGGDSVRLYGAIEASHGSDIRFNQQRLQGISKFINKIYNISRFVSSFPLIDCEDIKLLPADEWILSELTKTISESIQGYDVYDFNVPAKALRKFTVDLFASQYIEMVKGRAYNRDEAFSEDEQNAAHYALHKVLNTVIKAFAPLVPFVTDFIYRGLHGKTVHKEHFPKPEEIIKETKFTELTELLLESNSIIWKCKKDMKLPLNTPIKNAMLPKSLGVFYTDLKTMHIIDQLSSKPEELNSEAKKFSISNGEEIILSL